MRTAASCTTSPSSGTAPPPKPARAAALGLPATDASFLAVLVDTSQSPAEVETLLSQAFSGQLSWACSPSAAAKPAAAPKPFSPVRPTGSSTGCPTSARDTCCTRQTLYERLRMLERLLDRDLDAGEQRTELHVALLMLDVLRG